MLKKIKLINRLKFYSIISVFMFAIGASFLAYLNYILLCNSFEPVATINVSQKQIKWLTADVTMYNAGDPYQNDDTPCITADGTNVCSEVARGKQICASNFFPFGTELYIKGLGKCTVHDRMSTKYNLRIDWALEADKKSEAKQWGKKMVEYYIVQ